MKSPPWFAPWRLSCWIASSALSCAAYAQAPSSPPTGPGSAEPAPPRGVPSASRPTLALALEGAWARSLASAEATGRQRQAEAERRVARTWLAGAPTLEVLQREGRGAGAEGTRETEIGIALPLWRFGQRDRNTQTAQAESDWALAAEQAARLRLAGEVRELASRLQLAEVDVQSARLQRGSLEALSADVLRRVTAGDLAPADAMAARADLFAALAAEREAEQNLVAQRSAWLLLTGTTSEPALASASDAPDPAADVALDQHAEALLAEAAVQRARQRVAQVQAQRAAAPELGIGLRQERPGLGQPHQNSVAVALRLPFGSEPHNQPRLAAALAEEDVALMARQQLRLRLAAELDLAKAQLAAASARADTERERATLLRDRASLLKQSFNAGETSLPDLLRALAAAAQAEAAAARQQVAVVQARGRLHQALGQLP